MIVSNFQAPVVKFLHNRNSSCADNMSNADGLGSLGLGDKNNRTMS